MDSTYALQSARRKQAETLARSEALNREICTANRTIYQLRMQLAVARWITGILTTISMLSAAGLVWIMGGL